MSHAKRNQRRNAAAEMNLGIKKLKYGIRFVGQQAVTYAHELCWSYNTSRFPAYHQRLLLMQEIAQSVQDLIIPRSARQFSSFDLWVPVRYLELRPSKLTTVVDEPVVIHSSLSIESLKDAIHNDWFSVILPDPGPNDTQLVSYFIVHIGAM